jgi:hypothetical protein
MATLRTPHRIGMLLCLAGVLLRVDAAEGPRRELSLNGPWQAGVTRDAGASEPAAWEEVTVPHLRSGPATGGSDFLWYRRQVDLPADWAGGRVVLLLVGARYYPRVCVAGQMVAERIEGWTPFEVDLTDRVTPGKPFALSVRCQDWGATFADGFTLPAEVNGDLRDAPKAQLIAPIGGHFSHFGLWDDVVLERRPNTSLAEVAILPSIRRSELVVRGRCERPAAGLRVSATVLDGGQPALALAAMEPGVDGRWELRAAFPKARCWSPEDPHLYRLQVTLADGQGTVVDQVEERFGFRELWTDGADFVFNGVKRHLLASSGWPVTYSQSPEEIRENIRLLRQANVIAFRLHTQPWQRRWLEAADELGLMIIEEGALWCDGSGSYRYQDRRFWDNTWTHLAGMVRRDRNHASLVMWSIENEILHCGGARHYPECEAELADLGQRVKALDPGHLITFEADLDPKGIADVIGLHYPHEMPANKDYPNTADWLNQTVTTGTGGGLLGSRGAAFTWDRRKPLYIGEYLWVPYNDYSPGSVFFGDEAYLDRGRYKHLALAASWEHQTIAYRRAGVSGMCPWTFAGSGGKSYPGDPLYEVQQHVYVPLAIYRADLQTRFFAGDRPTLRFGVFNDTTRRQDLAVVLEVGGQEVARTDAFALEPAEYRQVELQPTLGTVTAAEGLPVVARLLAAAKEVHRAETAFVVSARQPLPVPRGQALLVFDPDGQWCQALGETPYRRLERLDELAQADPAVALLLVAPGAWKGAAVSAEAVPVIGLEDPAAAAVRAFLLAGGRALVLEQDQPDPWALGIELGGQASTMVFPTAAGHPFLAGLKAEDFRFWSEDHYVTRQELRRPAAGGGQALLVSGGASSLSHAALVDTTYGPGRVVFCQALVGTKLGTEPAARRLFRNLLDGLAAPVPVPRRTALVIGGDAAEAFAEAVRDVRLNAAPAGEPLSAAAGREAGLVVMHGGGQRLADSAAGLAACLAAGGTVYWHAPDPELFAQLREQLGVPRWQVVAATGPVTVRSPWTEELAGVCLEDLAFVGASRGDAWMRGFDLDPGVADRMVVPDQSGQSAGRRYELETMALSGNYVLVGKDGKTVVFASAGTAKGPAEVAGPGLYGVMIVAGGTSAQGGWPQVALSWNDRQVALVSLTGGEMRPYTTLAELPGGEGTLTVAFVNDVVVGREDRNLYVDAVEFSAAPADAGRETRFLTQPPALTAATVGPGAGRLVLDGVRWGTDGENRLRGRRYGSALLRNLGASFLPPEAEGSWVPAGQFEPVGTIPYFSKDDDHLSLVAAGTVQARFECAAPARYEVLIRGWSVPAANEYAKALLRLDGEDLGEVELRSRNSAVFASVTTEIRAGEHTLSVQYTNDLWQPPEDRNLYLQGVGFRRAGSM